MIPYHEKGLEQFKTLWDDCEPFYGGKSTVPDYQASLYYTRPEGDVHRINLSKAGTEDIATMYEACKPAQFGLNGETVLDETYRKAKKMDLDSFSTPFDPRSLGILDQVSRALLTGKRGPGITEMELYNLNVYGEGDFFKPHKDTPRNESMVGSLVVVLPTQHEGGQLVLRQGMQEWTVDFADEFTAAADPLVCFVAFFGDVEHEVLPVTSGYRVTLTYNLYYIPPHPCASCIPTPLHRQLKEALVELVNDKSTLPEGGYLGCGLVHQYVYTANQAINALLDHLKGADQIIARICEELGLRHSLTLLYRNLGQGSLHLIACGELTMQNPIWGKASEEDYLEDALHGLTIDNVEGVEIIGQPFDRDALEYEGDFPEFLGPFYRNPATKILEIRSMSSMVRETPYAHYGPQSCLEYMRAKAFMLITLDPVASRKELNL